MTASDLPVGSAPLPVATPQFPDRLHVFVWRNWGLVPVERMARVVGARPADLTAMGHRMGLVGPPGVTADLERRAYLTVIRRNWHLLPYEQLLKLLDWTPDRLAFTLREDDFLFAKLGSLKPKCEPLAYRAPDDATLQREADIARIVHEGFPDGVGKGREPLFAFVRQLSRPPARPAAPRATDGEAPMPTPRYCYSYFAPYGDPLLEPEPDPYPDGYLARLAEAGVDGVWLQAVLYKLSPFPWDPPMSEGWEKRLANLRLLVARAKRHGISIYLYLNEPRAMPVRWFASRPELKGVTEGDHAAMCTSNPDVRRFLTESAARICREVPDLGGFFTITASENLSHCWSHYGGAACPRCSKRPPAEVAAEVDTAIAEGIRGAGSRARLIAWDWGWPADWVQPIAAALPAGTSMMSVSEWDLPIHRGGVDTTVGEYSVSAIGPGPRAPRTWQAAREHGLRAMAKIQAGNSWELSAVPYVPALANVAQHAANLKAAGIDGLMLGWTLGGYPSPNLEVVSETWRHPGSVDDVLLRVARRRFGEAAAPTVVRAWHAFSTAYAEFPFHIGTVYSGPQQLGPANPLWGERTGYGATMVGFPYDDLAAWRAVYPPDVFVAQLRKVADGFEQGIATLKEAVQLAKGPGHAQALQGELNVAEAAAIHFASVANQSRFVACRDALAGKGPAEAGKLLDEMETLLQSEEGLARRLFAIQTRDSRIGFEASNHYYYVPNDLAEKVLVCRDLLTRWLPAKRQQVGASGG